MKPVIVFSSDDCPWNELPLSAIATMHARIGWQNLRKSEFRDSGEYLLITGTDFEQGCIIYSTCHYVSFERYEQDKNLQISEGCILITKDGTLGKVALVSNLPKPATLNAGVFNVVKTNAELDNIFLFEYLKSPLLLRYVSNNATGGTIKHLNQGILVNFPVRFPDLHQQRQLGRFFYSFDEIIISTTSQLSSLKQLKSACLISMFPQRGETIPRIRFKGFQDEWQHKQLYECLDVSKECNLKGEYCKDDVLSVSDDYGVMNQIELLGRSYAGKSVANYGVLKTGEIVYTKSPLKSKPYGIIKQNRGKTGIVSVLYAVYSAKEDICPDFIHYYFDPAWRLNDYLRPLINKGAKNTMNISDEMALKGSIMIPKDMEEQRRIAFFFRNLDTQISLQQQRLEKLKQIKAACLDKMFV